MLRMTVLVALLGAFPAAGQVCPSFEAIDLGAGGLNAAPAALVAADLGPAFAAHLFALGSFTQAGPATVPGIAAWDGAAWAAIPGAPSDAMVPAAAVGSGSGAQLYTSGNAIHRFDGVLWETLPFPSFGSVSYPGPFALAPFDADGSGHALMTGVFFGASGLVAARCDGHSWTRLGGAIPALGFPMTAVMQQFDADGDGPTPPRLYLFTHTLYEYAPNHFMELVYLFRFDGSAWTQVVLPATGVYGPFHAMVVYDQDGAGPLPPKLVLGFQGGVFSWDESAWTSIGLGITGAASMTVFDADGAGPGMPVLLASDTASPGGTIMAWDGAVWTPFPAAAPAPSTNLMAAYDDHGQQTLAIAAPELVPGAPVYNFAVWRTDHWSPPAPRPWGVLRALEVFNGGSGPRLIAAGSYSWIGLTRAFELATWDGQAWQPFTSGPEPVAANPGPVATCMVVHDDGTGPALYVAGTFASVAGQSVANIARWNGASWSRVGQAGPNGEVRALAVHDPDGPGPLPPMLYAAGLFTAADGLPARHIAVWNGTAWSEPPGGGTNNTVRALCSWNDGTGPALYVGGETMTPGGQAPSPIAKLGPAGWLPIAAPGLGIGYLNALAAYDDGTGAHLYGGGYTPVATNDNRLLMRFDGPAWTPVGFTALYQEIGTVLRTVAEGNGVVMYQGTSNRLMRWSGASCTFVGANPGYGAGTWAISPAVDDGSGSAAYQAVGPNQFSTPTLGQVQRIRPCPSCYANCDNSATPPVLNVNDFVCFLNRFAAGVAYANCDGSTTPPVLNVLDFTCFLNRFAAGCP